MSWNSRAVFKKSQIEIENRRSVWAQPYIQHTSTNCCIYSCLKIQLMQNRFTVRGQLDAVFQFHVTKDPAPLKNKIKPLQKRTQQPPILPLSCCHFKLPSKPIFSHLQNGNGDFFTQISVEYGSYLLRHTWTVIYNVILSKPVYF